jgi:hypothetical protein
MIIITQGDLLQHFFSTTLFGNFSITIHFQHHPIIFSNTANKHELSTSVQFVEFLKTTAFFIGNNRGIFSLFATIAKPFKINTLKASWKMLSHSTAKILAVRGLRKSSFGKSFMPI